jgi:hypothetical protein
MFDDVHHSMIGRISRDGSAASWKLRLIAGGLRIFAPLRQFLVSCSSFWLAGYQRMVTEHY